MKIKTILILLGVIMGLSSTILGQEKPDSVSNHLLKKAKKDITKYHFGIYGSVCDSYNPAGIFYPMMPDNSGQFYSNNYSYSNIKESAGVGGSGGVEFKSQEMWRWFVTFSIGISYYTYTYSALETISGSTYIPNYYSGSYSSQQNVNDFNYYTMLDFSLKNYLRIVESHTQRLAAGFGTTLSFNVLNNTQSVPEGYPAEADIPVLCLFISGNLRYEFTISRNKAIAIEPYYDYELRSVAAVYTRLSSIGMIFTLLLK